MAHSLLQDTLPQHLAHKEWIDLPLFLLFIIIIIIIIIVIIFIYLAFFPATIHPEITLTSLCFLFIVAIHSHHQQHQQKDSSQTTLHLHSLLLLANLFLYSSGFVIL